MELQLDELIQSIKKDGLEAAEQQKKDIVAEAENEARRIIERAKPGALLSGLKKKRMKKQPRRKLKFGNLKSRGRLRCNRPVAI